MSKNLICFSHLRWDFVFQRPQHLLTRFSHEMNVYFFEEPIFDSTKEAYYTSCKKAKQLWVIVPHLPANSAKEEVNSTLTILVEKFISTTKLNEYAFWYYTPMALAFSETFSPVLTVYDCMDELSAFKNAPAELKDLEKKLLIKADVVFTGGHTLYEAKKHQHPNIYPFPSSIDKRHFSKSRTIKMQPTDQAAISGTKLGFYGVIDERFDIDLIAGIADLKPEWQIILIGPIVKINPDTLPKNNNIHYLGQKSYEELPAYLAGWDLALIPFQLNESTRFISPTKTPEYLAAGVPVVSTPIRDVINPYGVNRLVHIAADHQGFVRAIESELKNVDKQVWLAAVDAMLSKNSWDDTYKGMKLLMENTATNHNKIQIAS